MQNSFACTKKELNERVSHREMKSVFKPCPLSCRVDFQENQLVIRGPHKIKRTIFQSELHQHGLAHPLHIGAQSRLGKANGDIRISPIHQVGIPFNVRYKALRANKSCTYIRDPWD